MRPNSLAGGQRRNCVWPLTTAQVLGIAIDAGHCEVVAAGLTGAPAGTVRIVPTPGTYPELLTALEPPHGS